MAKVEKNLPEKKEKTKKSGASKFLKAFTGIFRRMGHAISNTIAELKKVTWPTRKDLINYTAIVLAFMVLMAVVVGLLDLGATELISLIIRR